MAAPSVDSWVRVLPVAATAALLWVLGTVWLGRLGHPFDLEWMEGGMLAHAWRIQHGLPLYGPPSPDFVPFIYPPGYPALVALLGWGPGLSLPLGRAVSLVSTLFAAGALAFVVRRQGGAWWVAAATAGCFLGTYPQAGAFYDLVRPDALGLALLGWSLALGLERRRTAVLASGLLMAGAILVKHNLGALVVPVAIALILRDWRDALGFVVAATVPSGLVVAVLQWRSGGGLLTYLVQVPLSHPVRAYAGLVDTVRDWGMAVPVALLAAGLAAVGLAATRQRGLPTWLAAGVPAWSGALLGWWLTYDPPPAGSGVLNANAGLAAFALGAGAGAVVVLVAGWVSEAVQGQRRWPSFHLVYGVSVAGTTGLVAWWMRAHQGGFINVQAPLFWVAALCLGVVALRLDRAGPRGRIAAALVLTAQLIWSVDHVPVERLVPTVADTEAGWRVVESVRGTAGPVLSPFASWLPTYVGQPPSVHAMAVWDVNHPGGPFVDDVSTLDRAFREHRWEVVLGGTQGLIPSLPQHYEPVGALFEPGDTALMPRTGWMARPERRLEPRELGW